MDKLTAYQVLRIKSGSTREEIRAAYSALSKEFHPEEHPEEFQRIHEAYLTLTREARGRRRSGAQSAGIGMPGDNGEVHGSGRISGAQDDDGDNDNGGTEGTMQDDDGGTEGTAQDDNGDNDNGGTGVHTYDFDRVVWLAEHQRQEAEEAGILKAVSEFQRLLSPECADRVILFREFFKRASHQDVLRKQQFLSEVSELLWTVELKKEIYDCIIDTYRLKEITPDPCEQGLWKLYEVLEKKRGIYAGRKEKRLRFGMIGVVIVLLILPGMLTAKGLADSRISSVLQLGAILAIILILVYHELNERYSTQWSVRITVVLSAVLLSWLIVMALESYFETVFVSASADNLFVMLVTLGIAHLVLFHRKKKEK